MKYGYEAILSESVISELPIINKKTVPEKLTLKLYKKTHTQNPPLSNINLTKQYIRTNRQKLLKANENREKAPPQKT